MKLRLTARGGRHGYSYSLDEESIGPRKCQKMRSEVSPQCFWCQHKFFKASISDFKLLTLFIYLTVHNPQFKIR